MALDVEVAISFDLDSVMFEDTTGDYNVSTNPGGYGAPNDEFTDFAHYIILRHKNVNNVADEILVAAAYDPITDTEFSAPRDSDGWYEGVKLNIRIWSAGSYAAGTVRYHSGTVYLSNTLTSQTPGAGAEWDAVSDLTDIEDNATVLKTTDGRSTAYNADLYWSKQIATNSRRGKCGICEDDRQKERLDRIYSHIQAVVVGDSFGNNSSAAWNVLSLIQLGAIIE